MVLYVHKSLQQLPAIGKRKGNEMIRSFDLADGSTVTAVKTDGNGKGTREYAVLRNGVSVGRVLSVRGFKGVKGHKNVYVTDVPAPMFQARKSGGVFQSLTEATKAVGEASSVKVSSLAI
jgi:hypothetical protein